MSIKSKADTAPTTIIEKPQDRDAVASPRVIARQVFVHVESTAKRGGLDVVALHRIPLLRRKLQVDGEVRLIGEWPDNTDRRRDMDGIALREEYRRMQGEYIYETGNPEDGRRGDMVDLVTDFYGAPTSGRLVAVMRKLESAWTKLEAHLAKTGEKFPTPQQIEEVLALAAPENDFEDGIAYEPAFVNA